MSRYRVVIADDHAIFREGIRMVLSRNPDLEIVGEAPDGREAVRAALDQGPDLVIMDIAMPGLTGIEATREILAQLPETRVIILSVHSRKTFIMEALKAGARGYVVKDSTGEKLLHAVAAVLKGESYLDSPAAAHLVEEFVRSSFSKVEDSGGPALTDREKQILRLIVDGRTNRQIAEELCISPKTVENHRANIMSKLGLHDVIDMVKYAISTGLVDLDTWTRPSS